MTRFWLILAATLSAAWAHAFDLGGLCAEKSSGQTPDWRVLEKASRSGDRERAIALHKLVVRDDCGSARSWFGLAEALAQAGRRAEAAEALAEMEKKSSVFRPAYLDRHPGVRSLLDSAQFKASDYGRVFAARLAAAQERRRVFRARLREMPAQNKPADPYVAKGASPGGFCRYDRWPVKADTDLFAAPGSSRTVGRAVKGTQVRGVTGEIHLKPIPIGVVVEYEPMSKGDIVFQLNYAGDGATHYWYNGRIDRQDMTDVEDYCLVPDPYCWGEYLFPDERRVKDVWWVQVELPDGTRGWTDRPERFDGTDSCR